MNNEVFQKKKQIQLDLFSFFQKDLGVRGNNLETLKNNQELTKSLKRYIKKARDNSGELQIMLSGVDNDPYDFIDYHSLNMRQLQEFARSRKIPNRSRMGRSELADFLSLYDKSDPSEEELQQMLGKGWTPLQNRLGFIYKEKTIICGILSSFNQFVQETHISGSFELLDTDLRREELETSIEIKNSFQVIRFNTFFYQFELLVEVIRILGNIRATFQNDDGILLCLNETKFAMIMPIIFE